MNETGGAGSDGWSAPPPPPAGGSLPPPPPAPPAFSLPPPPLPLETATVVERGARRGRLLAGALAIVVVVAGALAFVASGSSATDPDEALADAQAFVQDAESYRFELQTVERLVTGDPDGAGSDTTVRSVASGEVAGPEHWRSRSEAGDAGFGAMTPFEVVRVGDTAYQAGGLFEGDAASSSPPWVEVPGEAMESSIDDLVEFASYAEEGWSSFPSDGDAGSEEDPYIAQEKLQLALAGYLFMAPEGDPTGITRLVTEATEPAVEEELADGGVRLRVRLAPVEELEEAIDQELPPVDLLLDLDEENRPVLAQFSTEADRSSADVEITFSDWGADIDIRAPADSDIDHTPSISEEDLAEAPELVLAPSAPPPGFSLSSAYRYDYDDEPCESVDLQYVSDAEADIDYEELTLEEMDALIEDSDYLMLSYSEADCADDYDDTPFDETFAGFPARGGDGGYWEVLIGDVWVYVDSTLDASIIEPLVASLHPVTIDGLAAMIPDWVDEMGW